MPPYDFFEDPYRRHECSSFPGREMAKPLALWMTEYKERVAQSRKAVAVRTLPQEMIQLERFSWPREAQASHPFTSFQIVIIEKIIMATCFGDKKVSYLSREELVGMTDFPSIGITVIIEVADVGGAVATCQVTEQNWYPVMYYLRRPSLDASRSAVAVSWTEYP